MVKNSDSDLHKGKKVKSVSLVVVSAEKMVSFEVENYHLSKPQLLTVLRPIKVVHH